MRLGLRLATFYVPGFYKRGKLRELLGRVARAFGANPPDAAGKSFAECLELFARFTQAQVDRAYAAGAPVEEIQDRLRREGLEFAGGIRKALGIESRAEVMKAARLLYRILGIDFDGRPGGAITIRRCYFSGIYSERTCAVIGALDEGVLAGLSGGGRLAFSARITQGCGACSAAFHFEDQPS